MGVVLVQDWRAFDLRFESKEELCVSWVHVPGILIDRLLCDTALTLTLLPDERSDAPVALTQ